MQREFLGAGRRNAVANTTEVLATCTTLLGQWRSRLWPRLHLKRVARSAWFNPANTLTDWLPPFRQRPGEMTLEHPSACNSARCNEYISHVGVTTYMLFGFSLEETVLADRRGEVSSRARPARDRASRRIWGSKDATTACTGRSC